ncbi:hypothetical protein [Sanguibacter sp. HDW7]|uniref:hypothetical protein n=1 Tax=Sanguibacter sp. HDW7 TaxID=2714931 RepID=UPI001407EB74|nr:hypothetical protein [Sanguibacter sp. HDW7]QIK82935.1 hypothetical protein G7063_04315 [Sanguibacter sp. HDW7]
MSIDPPIARDAGLPAERSSLAWQRTVLGVTLGAIVAGTTALHAGHWWLAVGALVLATIAVWPGVLRPTRHRTLADGGLAGALVREGWPLLRRAALLVVALAVVGATASVVGMLP